MSDTQWLHQHTQRTLDRLIPRLQVRFKTYARKNPEDWGIFVGRLETHFGRLFAILLHLYRDRYDFFYHLEELLAAIAQSWIDRPPALKTLDQEREDNVKTDSEISSIFYHEIKPSWSSGVVENWSTGIMEDAGMLCLVIIPPFQYSISPFRCYNSRRSFLAWAAISGSGFFVAFSSNSPAFPPMDLSFS